MLSYQTNVIRCNYTIHFKLLSFDGGWEENPMCCMSETYRRILIHFWDKPCEKLAARFATSVTNQLLISPLISSMYDLSFA